MSDMDSWLNNVYSNAMSERKFGSVRYQRPSGSFGETGFKQGVPQTGGSPFRAPNAGVTQSWDGAKMRDPNTRPTNWKGAIALYKANLDAEDDGTGSTTPAPAPVARAPRRSRTPAPASPPPARTPGTLPPTAFPPPPATGRGRRFPRLLPRSTPAPTTATPTTTPVATATTPPATTAPATTTPATPSSPAPSFEVQLRQERVRKATQEARAEREATPTPPPYTPPAFTPTERAEPVMATNRPPRTPLAPATPPAFTPTPQQQQAIEGVAEMRAQRQNPPATPATGTRAQNRAPRPKRQPIGDFGKKRITENLSPFT